MISLILPKLILSVRDGIFIPNQGAGDWPAGFLSTNDGRQAPGIPENLPFQIPILPGI
jgi:hypothetical protein